MSKTKVNKELLELMDDYQLFMHAERTIPMPISLRNEKPNHKPSLYTKGEIILPILLILCADQ